MKMNRMKQRRMKMKAKLFLILLVTAIFILGCTAKNVIDDSKMGVNCEKDPNNPLCFDDSMAEKSSELDDELDEALEELDIVEE